MRRSKSPRPTAPEPALPTDRRPLVEPVGDLTVEEARRYARHLVLPEVGLDGQRRLRATSVLVVGAGGLGSPVLTYLAAAGVGRLAVVDDACETLGKPYVWGAIQALHGQVSTFWAAPPVGAGSPIGTCSLNHHRPAPSHPAPRAECSEHCAERSAR